MPNQEKKIASAVKKKSLSWDDLHTLAILGVERSYKGAANVLRLSRGTVVRRIQRLELAVGVQVVDEAMGHVVLTSEGLQLLVTANEMQRLASSIQGAKPGLQSQIHGLVRITAPEGIAANLVTPSLAKLKEAHPDLKFELLADSEILSLSHKQADVAIRLRYPTDSNLIALRIGSLGYSLYASDTLVTQQSADFDWIKKMALIGYETTSRFPETTALIDACSDSDFSFRSNNLPSQIEATRAGLGIALLPDYVHAKYPELAKISPMPIIEKDVFIVFHCQYRDEARIRTVVDWLKSSMQQSLMQAS